MAYVWSALETQGIFDQVWERMLWGHHYKKEGAPHAEFWETAGCIMEEHFREREQNEQSLACQRSLETFARVISVDLRQWGPD